MPLPVVLIASVVPVVVGVLVLRRQRVIGWLLIVHGVSFGLLAPGQPAVDGRVGLAADQLFSGAWVFFFVWVALVGYLLPTGEPFSPFWRRWVRAGVVGTVVFLVGAAGDAAGFRRDHHGAAPPIAWLSSEVSAVLGLAGLLSVILLLFGSPVALLLRLRRSVGEQRLQLLWLVWGATTVPVALLVGWVEYFLLGGRFQWAFWTALGLSAVALPLATGVAILRHRLFDIELVLSRTLTYGALTALVLGVYGGLLLLTGRLFDASPVAGLVPVVVVAVTVHPAYSWVSRRVTRWVYGLRSEPHVALRRLVDRTDAAEPGALVRAVTDTIAEAVRADDVRVGAPGTGIPLVHRGEHVGDLVIRLPPGRRLDAADQSLLRDLTRYAALLVSSALLYDEVRDSRLRIVASREEERRRLRRDMHDGLGPSLAAVVLKLNAVQNLGDDPSRRDRLIGEAKDEVKTAIAEVRRLVSDLRPPAVDEVGLLQALRQRAAALSGELRVLVEGPQDLPPLPAAVETAAFRIASEAMTNAVRHSRATYCRVRLSAGDEVVLTIRDDGRGLARGPNIHGSHEGVGLSSMRQRAAELGGTCTIGDHQRGGVLVVARLPLTAAFTTVPRVEAPA